MKLCKVLSLFLCAFLGLSNVIQPSALVFEKSPVAQHIAQTKKSPVAQHIAQTIRTCTSCKKQDKAFKACGRCEQVFYCSAECQKDDWKTHKVSCKKQLVGEVDLMSLLTNALMCDKFAVLKTFIYEKELGSLFAHKMSAYKDELGSPLIDALTSDNFAIVQKFISDVELVSELTNALYQGKFEKAKKIINSGVQVNIADYQGYYPLFIAAREGNLPIVELLLKKKALLDSLSLGSFTPLHIAGQEGHLEIARLLIDQGAKVDCLDQKGQTPLHYAAHQGKDLAVTLLVKAGACIDQLDRNKATPLIYAAANGFLSIVRYFISCGANVTSKDCDGYTALFLAAEQGHSQVVKLLIQQEGVSSDGGNALHVATARGELGIVMTLVEAGANINLLDSEGASALHIAVEMEQPTVATFLLSNFAAVDSLDNDGCTPLYVAASNGQMELVRLLVEALASVDKSCKQKITPLSSAAEHGFTSIVEYLILHKANVNSQDCNGYTPLHVAVEGGHGSVVKILLRSGANIASENNKGLNALHIAAAEGYFEGVKTLVAKLVEEKRVDLINKLAKNGKTPLSAAQENGHQEIVVFLKKIHKYHIVEQQVNDLSSSFADLSIADLVSWIGDLDSTKQSMSFDSYSGKENCGNNKYGPTGSPSTTVSSLSLDKPLALSSKTGLAIQEVEDACDACIDLSDGLQQNYEEDGDFTLVEQQKSHNSKVTQIDLPNVVCFHDRLNNTKIVIPIQAKNKGKAPSLFRATNISYANRIGSKEKSDYRHMFPLKIDRYLEHADWSQRESSDGKLQWHAELNARFIYLDRHGRCIDYVLEYTFNEKHECYHRFARSKRKN
jgi:ankyrin repeat protein